LEEKKIMSHVDNISTHGEEFGLVTLLALCNRKGWQFLEGQETYAWWGRSEGDYPVPAGFTADDLGKCDHAIRIPGCRYEIGLVKRDNGYAILADFWESGGLDQVLGQKGELFVRDYAMQQDICTAEANGWAWEEIPASMAGATKIRVAMEMGGGW